MAVKQHNAVDDEEDSYTDHPINIETLTKAIAYLAEMKKYNDDAEFIKRIITVLRDVPIMNPQEINVVNCAIQKLKVDNPALWLNELYTLIQTSTNNLPTVLALLLNCIPKEQIDTYINHLAPSEADNKLIKCVNTLCDWACMTYKTHVNEWVYGFLRIFQKQSRYVVLHEIAQHNVNKLLKIQLVPIFRQAWTNSVIGMLEHLDVKHYSETMISFENLNKQLQRENVGEIMMSPLINAMFQFVKKTRLKVEIDNFRTKYSLFIDNLYSKDITSFQMPTTCNARVGLVNLGNTCYMNSVLQALLMTKSFSRKILLLPDIDIPFLVNIQRLLALLLHSERQELTPREILSEARPPGFHDGHQQDSSEFLGHLLDKLDEQERSMVIDNSSKVQLMDVDYDNAIMTEDEEDKKPLIQNTFGGQISITYKCLSCKTENRHVDSFRDLQLSFPDRQIIDPPKFEYKVQDLLDYFCSPEKLDGDNKYFCDKCKQLCDGERDINIMNPPKYLILTLKHFKYDQRFKIRSKLHHNVFHDEYLNLKVIRSVNGDNTTQATSAVDKQPTINDVCAYQLYAAVVHSGSSVDCGHYYTYGADKPNQWFMFNDHFVTNSSLMELQNLKPPNTPYILFYKRMNSDTDDDQQIEFPSLDELPVHLRTYVDEDNRIYKNSVISRSSPKIYSYDDDNDPPPGSLGDNSVRYIY